MLVGHNLSILSTDLIHLPLSLPYYIYCSNLSSFLPFPHSLLTKHNSYSAGNIDSLESIVVWRPREIAALLMAATATAVGMWG